jgi:murein DD-endopeptidase MepM/ murein hydrolase activator NlpD
VASERSFSRRLRVLTVITAVAVPVIAISTVDATAHEPVPYTATHKPPLVDEMTVRQSPHRAANSAAARRTASSARRTADRARASRSFVRLLLNAYVRPVPGPVTQWYGYHPGIDIAPPYGTPIGAAHAGVVTFVGWQDGYGMHVEVRQGDGFVTTYSHMSAFTVKVGQLVVAGQQVGNVGSTGYSTGPHLHFEVHLPNGSRTDPAAWLRSHGVAV